MTFTRDELANYEKAAPAAQADEPEVTQNSAEPAGDEESLAPDSDSSPEEGSDSAASEEDGSTAEDAASAAATDPDSPTGEDEQAAPATRTRTVPYERFQEVVDERNALRKFGEYLQQAQRTTAAPATDAPASEPPVADAETAEPAPTLEQFDFDPVAHGVALQKWIGKQVASGVKQQLEAERKTQTIQQVKSAFDARVEEFKQANPEVDYDTLVSNPNLPKLVPGTSLAILKSEHGPALIAHLAAHPDVATRLARKSADEQMVEIGRLEAKISQPAAPAPKPAAKTESTDAKTGNQPPRTRTVTKAPPPPRPVSAGKSPTTRNSLDPNLSMEDFVALERQKKIDARSARQKMRASMR